MLMSADIVFYGREPAKLLLYRVFCCAEDMDCDFSTTQSSHRVNEYVDSVPLEQEGNQIENPQLYEHDRDDNYHVINQR